MRVRAESRERHGEGGEQGTPFALVVDRLRAGAVMVEEAQPAAGQMALDERRGGSRCPYHVRSAEGGDDRHCHDDGVKEIAGDPQGGAQGGNNEGKFAYLRQAKTGLDGGLQGLPGKEDATGAEERLPDDDGRRNDENGNDVLRNHGGVYHHADGNEEDGGKEVFHRLDKTPDGFRLDGLRQYGTHDESAEGGRETGVSG